MVSQNRLVVALILSLFLIIQGVLGAENHQYANVPHHEEYEFGYHRGNKDHFQERHESRHGPKFKTKVRWGDSQGGHGEQLYDYNHHDKHGHHEHGH